MSPGKPLKSTGVRCGGAPRVSHSQRLSLHVLCIPARVSSEAARHRRASRSTSGVDGLRARGAVLREPCQHAAGFRLLLISALARVKIPGQQETSVYSKFSLTEPAAVPIISDEREFTAFFKVIISNTDCINCKLKTLSSRPAPFLLRISHALVALAAQNSVKRGQVALLACFKCIENQYFKSIILVVAAPLQFTPNQPDRQQKC
ncbi:hypothetical protein EVAR_43459_1 [Eumeta japonica]|uniref:Uncharacterized protein n=1 Tax=Eumeta variegata TaxID=151549 RepID=A0A4C1YBM0_EUMVA|nr:hypothetical protein EVAR_43459_1 [Eumeta japonica]